MHRKISAAGEHRRLDFFHKDALAAHGIDRNVEALISHRLDDHFLDRQIESIGRSMVLEQFCHVIGLP